jgi:MoaA/NifB/PqqE/SkfB family radical SAM enzyme
MSLGLISSGVDIIIVSIDAHTQAVYDRIRIGGDFSRVVKNVEFLLKHKKEKSLDKPTVVTQFIVDGRE